MGKPGDPQISIVASRRRLGLRMRRGNGSQRAAKLLRRYNMPGKSWPQVAIGRCFIKHGRAKLAHGIGDEYRVRVSGDES